MGLCDAVALVILLSFTERSLPVTRTRADAPRDQRTLCVDVCVRVSVPTHVSVASLAPRPKSLRPTVSSGILPSIASRPHTRTHAQGPNTHML